MDLSTEEALHGNGSFLQSPSHRSFLIAESRRQLDFFAQCKRPSGGFFTLEQDGKPIHSGVQELHNTSRMVHSYSLGKLAGFSNCEEIIAHGMDYLWGSHLDKEHGGFFWSLDGDEVHDSKKMAYGHMFVLLAASSAHAAGHPTAAALLDRVEHVLDQRFWEDTHQLYSDEWNRDWTPFSTYRGMNSNMHGVEALLSAFEVTGREKFLDRAGAILKFFIFKIAAEYSLRVPEHFTEKWSVDQSYSGNPMFRPSGSTPGHSFELARLLLQYWDLAGRPQNNYEDMARKLAYTAVNDAWDEENGGFYYTVALDGKPKVTDRYWWPVTEAIGVMAAFLKLGGTTEDNVWYQRLWQFAEVNLIDQKYGGWFPELDERNRPINNQFVGKPDIYHSLQASLFPLTLSISRQHLSLRDVSYLCMSSEQGNV